MVESRPSFVEDAKTLEITIDGGVKDGPVFSTCGGVFPESMLMTNPAPEPAIDLQ